MQKQLTKEQLAKLRIEIETELSQINNQKLADPEFWERAQALSKRLNEITIYDK